MARRRIVWDQHEEDKIANKLFSLYLQHPGAPITGLLDMAQEQLPPHRRRNIQSLKAACPRIWDKFTTMVKNVNHRLHNLEEKIRQLEAKLENGHRNMNSLKQHINELPDHAVIGLFWDRLGKCVQSFFVSRPTHDLVDDIQESCEKSKLPKIAIIGLINPQIAMLDREYRGIAKIIHINKDNSNFTIPSDCYVIQVKGFIPHAVSERIKKLVHRSSIYNVKKGMDSIRKVIDGIIEGHEYYN